MRKYVMGEKRNGYTKEVRNVYNYRVRKYALDGLRDLSLLADKLPEDQLAEIFNAQTMQGLFRALLQLNADELIKDKELLKKKRRRLLPICEELIRLLNGNQFAHLMAPTIYPFMMREGGQLPYLKAVYYRAQTDESEEDKRPLKQLTE